MMGSLSRDYHDNVREATEAAPFEVPLGPTADSRSATVTALDKEMSKAVAKANRKPRAKRSRQFILEGRHLPSKLGALFFATPTEWSHITTAPRLRYVRKARHELELDDRSPGLFTRGAEYRVRRIDPPAAA